MTFIARDVPWPVYWYSEKRTGTYLNRNKNTDIPVKPHISTCMYPPRHQSLALGSSPYRDVALVLTGLKVDGLLLQDTFVFSYFRAYIHSRFKNAILDMHLNCLRCLCNRSKTSMAASVETSLDGAVVMSSANGLVGTGFASRYWLQPRGDF